MLRELEYIRDKNLSVKETLEFYIHIGDSPIVALDKTLENNSIEVNLKKIEAFNKLTKLINILNEGWYPDWNNTKQLKWFNYFNMEDGLPCWYTGSYGTATVVPSALCLKSKELCDFLLKNYIHLYEDLYK